jgi:hypothetical protein
MGYKAVFDKVKHIVDILKMAKFAWGLVVILLGFNAYNATNGEVKEKVVEVEVPVEVIKEVEKPIVVYKDKVKIVEKPVVVVKEKVKIVKQ